MHAARARVRFLESASRDAWNFVISARAELVNRPSLARVLSDFSKCTRRQRCAIKAASGEIIAGGIGGVGLLIDREATFLWPFKEKDFSPIAPIKDAIKRERIVQTRFVLLACTCSAWAAASKSDIIRLAAKLALSWAAPASAFVSVRRVTSVHRRTAVRVQRDAHRW